MSVFDKLDTCSITMIKFARKRGLDYHFDIAEIPKYFLNENIHVDKERYKLPEVPLRNSDNSVIIALVYFIEKW